MKIDPIPQPTVRLFADSRSPATSFVDMVRDTRAVGGDGPPQVALGFQALGMFGRHEAVEHVERDKAPSVELSASKAPSPRSLSLSVVAPSDTGAIVIGPAAPPRATAVSENPVQEPRVRPAPGTAQTGRPTADGLAIEPTVPGAANEEPTPPAAVRSGSRKGRGRPEAQIRLALYSSGSGVAVTVTAPGLSVCDIQRFRERADALLRDHGILLDKVAVNGEGRTRVDAFQGSQGQWR